MAVEDGAEGALEAGLQRRDQRAAAADLLADALVDQHVGVDRHTHGERDAGDARQGQRRPEQRQAAEQQAKVEEQRDVGIDAELSVEHDHEEHDERDADDAGKRAGMDRIGAEARTDRALLEDGERRRQRAAPLRDGLADHRRADHLVVEHDGEELADIGAGRVGEAARARRIEGEGDHRRAVVVEGGLRVGERVAADHDALLDDDRRALPGAAVLQRQQLVAGRQVAALGVLDIDARVDEAQRQLGGAADELLHVLGILDAGKLDEDAVLPFALDDRLLGAGLVDTAPHDLDRLLDRRAGARLERDGVGLQRDIAARGDGHVDLGIDLLDEGADIVEPLGLAQREGDAVALGIEPGIADARRAELAAQRIDQRVEALAPDGAHVDLEQQMRAAAQIEAEAHLLLRDPPRQGIERLRREQIGQAQDHAQRANPQDQRHQPFRKVKHRRIRLLAPGGAAGASLAFVRVRVVLLYVVLFALGGDRLGLRQDGGDGAAHDPDAHALGDVDQHLVVADHFGDRADDAAAGDDAVATPQRAQHAAVVARLLLLRPDDEEIEYDEDQHEGCELHQGIRAVSERLRIGGRDEHRSLLA